MPVAIFRTAEQGACFNLARITGNKNVLVEGGRVILNYRTTKEPFLISTRPMARWMVARCWEYPSFKRKIS